MDKLWLDSEIIVSNGKKWLNKEASHRLYLMYKSRLDDKFKNSFFSLEWAEQVMAKYPPTEEMQNAMIVSAYQEERNGITTEEFLFKLPKMLGKMNISPSDMIRYGHLLNNKLGENVFDETKFIATLEDRKCQSCINFINRCQTFGEIIGNVKDLNSLLYYIKVYATQKTRIFNERIDEEIFKVLEQKNFFDDDINDFVQKLIDLKDISLSSKNMNLYLRMLIKRINNKRVKEKKELAVSDNQIENYIQSKLHDIQNGNPSVNKEYWLSILITSVHDHYKISDDELRKTLENLLINKEPFFYSKMDIEKVFQERQTIANIDLDDLFDKVIYPGKVNLSLVYNSISNEQYQEIEKMILSKVGSIFLIELKDENADLLWQMGNLILSTLELKKNEGVDTFDKIASGFGMSGSSLENLAKKYYTMDPKTLREDIKIEAKKCVDSDDMFGLYSIWQMHFTLFSDNFIDQIGLTSTKFKACMLACGTNIRTIPYDDVVDYCVHVLNKDIDEEYINSFGRDDFILVHQELHDKNWYPYREIEQLLRKVDVSDDQEDLSEDEQEESLDDEEFEIFERRRPESKKEYNKVALGVTMAFLITSIAIMSYVQKVNPITAITSILGKVFGLVIGRNNVGQLIGNLISSISYYALIGSSFFVASKLAFGKSKRKPSSSHDYDQEDYNLVDYEGDDISISDEMMQEALDMSKRR